MKVTGLVMASLIGLVFALGLASAEFQTVSCTTGWHITGYFTPVESDYSGAKQTISVQGQTRSFYTSFLNDVKIEGWGKTLAGDYIGWWDNSWHRASYAMDSLGNKLVVGKVATDPSIIPKNTALKITTLPSPWNSKIFTTGDVGPSIQGKDIDVFTGEGKAAELETFRITGDNQQVCTGKIVSGTTSTTSSITQIASITGFSTATTTTATDSYDDAGVKKIYQTASGGRTWYLGENPTSDSYFKSDTSVTKNSDGSWKAGRTTLVKDTPTRLTATTANGAKEWRNVEMTGYFKINSYSMPEEITFHARGAVPSNGNVCDASALEGYLTYEGGEVGLRKKIWHTGGYTEKVDIDSVTGGLQGRWVGMKLIIFNTGSDVKTELWLDKNSNNEWVKVSEYKDAGGWNGASINSLCKDIWGNTMTLDEKVFWDGPDASFRVDNALFDFKKLSVREIDGSAYLGGNGGTTTSGSTTSGGTTTNGGTTTSGTTNGGSTGSTSTSGTTGERRFYNTIYTISSDPNAINAAKVAWNEPTNQYDIVLEDTNPQAWAKAFPNHRTMIGAASLTWLTTAKISQAESLNFGPNDIIYYDAEDWDLTPGAEQESVAISVKKACDAIHKAGYKCGITPQLTDDIKAQMKAIDWDLVDVLVLQEQRFSRYPLATDRLKAEVNEIVSYAKADNSRLMVLVQLSMRQASNCYDYRYNVLSKTNAAITTNNPSCVVSSSQTMANLKGTINELSKMPGVDGIMTTYMPADGTNTPGYVCPQIICNPTNLKNILLYVEGFKK